MATRRPGRPPGWVLDAESPGVLEDVTLLGDKQRIAIPAGLAESVEWATGGAPALGVLREPGRIEILEWNAHSPKVLERRRELMADVDPNDEIPIAVRLLDDRYRQLLNNLTAYFSTRGFTHPEAVVHAQAQAFGLLQRQASFQAFMDCFTILGWVVLLGVPLVFLIKKFKPVSSSANH